MDSNHILTDDKNRQIPLVGGPKMSPTNPRCETAAILKKIEKSPYIRNSLTDFDKIWQGDAPGISTPDSPLKF